MRKFAFALACIALFSTAKAQEKVLPKGFAPYEVGAPASMYNTGNGRGVATPPPFPVRTMAQWEEVQSLVITWTSYPAILAQIVDAAQEECEVIIHCQDSTQVQSYLTSTGVPLTNISYLEVPYNSIWIRDYGAHTVYKNDVDSVLLVEWIYNRPRPADDVIPDAYAAFKGIGLHSATQAPNDLVNTGGNWMVDGLGTAFASKLILDENDVANPYGVTVKTEADVDTIMKHFHGIDRYIKMETLPYDDIHHIDMHMKLLDEQTLLIGEYPTGISDGPQIEANMLYVTQNFNAPDGDPYRVIRIPQPPSTGGAYPGQPYGNGYYRTYTNNIIINKTILVPYYREEYDTTALRILSDAMPGYNIVGIDSDNSGANLVSAGGVLHCITNLIGVDDPLLIQHFELDDTYDDQNPYVVNADIMHKSGISTATLYYSLTPGSGYQSVSMSNSGGNSWTANIPAQAIGSTVYYYIHAQAVSGKQQVRPMVAPTGYFSFDVLGTPTSVEDLADVELQDIFPNPANAITCIPVQSKHGFNGSIQVYDISGRWVETVFEGNAGAGEKYFFIHADQYSPGAYQVVLTTGETRSVKRFMVR